MSAFHHTVRTVTPFHDRSRHSRLIKIMLWLVGIAVALVICNLAGFDVLAWFQSLWDTMKEIAPVYIVAAPVTHVAATTANRPYERAKDVQNWAVSNDPAIAKRYGATWAIRSGRLYRLPG